jgi:hypothetical protein
LDVAADLLDVRAVLRLRALHILELSGQVFVGHKVLAQPNEGPDDQDIQGYRALARQHGGKHRHSAPPGNTRVGTSYKSAKSLSSMTFGPRIR